ncbi:ImmA/IrrE family metallo-endopeptidase [Microbacterium lacticum]
MVDASPLSRAAICDYAERVADEYANFRAGDELKVNDLVSHLGGRVVAADSFIASEALTVRAPRDFTVHIPMLTSHRRDRFTIAHELGHYFLHYLYPGTSLPKTFSRGGRDLAETQANYFAAALLMPSNRFARVWRASDGDEWAVADRFGVSASAASVRAQSLGLAS